MNIIKSWPDPVQHLRRHRPDHPILYFSPKTLQATAAQFQAGFPGLVTYAVKANPDSAVLGNLWSAGITAFDVASPAEMALVRDIAPKAVLHYNNPVRSLDEITKAIQFNVTSYSIDTTSELDKLHDLPKGTEVAVRLRMPVTGAAYDFGAKFGATPDVATMLLKTVAKRGLTPSICFHPGTQCADPNAWAQYITASATIAAAAKVEIKRLNVGGGFASHRDTKAPNLQRIFSTIQEATVRAFGTSTPALLCEPGRAMVAESFALATRIKARRDCGAVFLNDGIYGALAEARDMTPIKRLKVIAPDGTIRGEKCRATQVFGPTCDSIDQLAEALDLPADLVEGDYVIFYGMGAYSVSLATRFNGYGPEEAVTVFRIKS